MLVHVDLFGGGDLGQAGHGEDVAGEGNQEAGAGGDLNVPHGDGEVLRGTQELGVIGEGILGLGHADGQVIKAEVGELLELLLRGGGDDDAVSVIDLGSDGVELVLNAVVDVVDELEVVGLVAQAHDFLSQRKTAFAALGPHFAQADVDAQLAALALDEVELGLGVGRERVDGDDAGETVDVLHVVDVLEEVERELKIKVRPLAFAISCGETFRGVYNIYEHNLSLFTSDERQTADASTVEINDLASPELDEYITERYANQLREDTELVEGVYDAFDREAYLRAELAPVFFGSAVNNFGVKELLECFIRIAPSPRPAPTETRIVEPAEAKMTGFVFKIHANMDPNHRDRIAFLKICSGTFERNKNYLHVRSGKQMKFSSPTAFMAEKKSIIDFAYPGDIVGLHDTGNFKIGDTFTEGEKLKFTGIPSFAPEQFRYIENADPLKFKQLAKGIDQLMDEGVAQLFTSSLNGRKIIGTVGALQFEVIEYRLAHEYNAACRWEPISIYKACWIESDNAEQLADFKRRKHTNMAIDKHGRDVFLADTSYALALAQENFKDIRFYFTSEF